MAADRRSPASLHQTTKPPGTFPYYHADEETVLSQAQRLSHHRGFTGAGVTIAFLDSGFYPHPDLSVPDAAPLSDPLGMLPETEAAGPLHRQPVGAPTLPFPATGRMAHRIVHYVDQQDGQEAEGLTLASLWDDAGDSWHGQMTTVLAAGNGRLSNGHFAGLAPEAQILPIKIGRSRGGIPEADILRGVEWLLRDDNWQRYGVRVLNVSVGGDDPMPWHKNPVCRAVEELSRRGVLVVAAAGNSGKRALLAPAQAPSVLTVGGLDDHNRPWRRHVGDEVAQLDLYHHNWDWVEGYAGWHCKPNLLAPAKWLPGPILPVSPLFATLSAATRLAKALDLGDRPQVQRLLAVWGERLGITEAQKTQPAQIRRAIRRVRNKHKWVAPFTQHVDGTSTAAPIVAAVAAQMIQANPHLSPADVRRLLVETAMPLPHLEREKQGAGVVQPALAVAAALRAPGGWLQGLPPSGFWISDAQFHEDGLQKILIQGTVATEGSLGSDGGMTGSALVYFGHHAPHARSVSVTGPFNHWQPEKSILFPDRDGWWHGVLPLPRGTHPYRFWVDSSRPNRGTWTPDPENPNRTFSGFQLPHSVAVAP
jgi:serine protease AprX